MKDAWDELREAIARQDEGFAEVTRALEMQGDATLLVPQGFLDELDELTSPRVAAATPFVMGLRA